jgi:hypothetical protein
VVTPSSTSGSWSIIVAKSRDECASSRKICSVDDAEGWKMRSCRHVPESLSNLKFSSSGAGTIA